MGYLTLYKIKFSHNKNAIREYINNLLEEEKKKIDNYALENPNDLHMPIVHKCDFYWNTNEYVKWYDYDDDILRVSNEFKDVLITVYGNGEDDGDKWVQYFYNGRKTAVYAAKIIIKYKDFSEKDLE